MYPSTRKGFGGKFWSPAFQTKLCPCKHASLSTTEKYFDFTFWPKLQIKLFSWLNCTSLEPKKLSGSELNKQKLASVANWN